MDDLVYAAQKHAEELAEYRAEEAMYEAQMEYYNDWLSDNIDYLRKEFIADVHYDEFNDYCRDAFRQDGRR